MSSNDTRRELMGTCYLVYSVKSHWTQFISLHSTVILIGKKWKEATPRVELGLLDSESNVITTTLRRPAFARVSFVFS